MIDRKRTRRKTKVVEPWLRDFAYETAVRNALIAGAEAVFRLLPHDHAEQLTEAVIDKKTQTALTILTAAQAKNIQAKDNPDSIVVDALMVKIWDDVRKRLIEDGESLKGQLATNKENDQ